MQLLTKGNRQRTQEPTATNKTSSRSHAVLQVTVHQRSRGGDLAEEVRLGRLFMVDLAGSERAAQVLASLKCTHFQVLLLPFTWKVKVILSLTGASSGLI